jgi:hypothetical protein
MIPVPNRVQKNGASVSNGSVLVRLIFVCNPEGFSGRFYTTLFRYLNASSYCLSTRTRVAFTLARAVG